MADGGKSSEEELSSEEESSSEEELWEQFKGLTVTENDQTLQMETLEGTTYKSAVDRLGEAEAADIQPIPEPLVEPIDRVIDTEATNLVFFDLETTGLAPDDDIIQIAAEDKESRDAYSTYVKPVSKEIPEDSITELEMRGGTMYYKHQPVDSSTITEALDCFGEWLAKYKPCILVSQNVNFDARMLVRACQRTENTSVLSSVTGFVDTLPLFRIAYPGRTSYGQEDLVKDLLKTKYDAHNASADVKALHQLYDDMPQEYCNIQNKVVSVEKIRFKIEWLQNKKQIRPRFDDLVARKIMNITQAKSVAGSGLTPGDLREIFERSGKDGLLRKLKPLVKRPAPLCNALTDYFQS